MPLPREISKVSARSVYSRKKIEEKTETKGRGRPKKNRVSETFKEKIERRGRPRKIIKAEEHSSEADASSEGEDEDMEAEKHSDSNASSEENNVADNSADPDEENEDEGSEYDEVSEEKETSEEKTSDDEEVRYSLPVKTFSPKACSTDSYSSPKETSSKRKSCPFEEVDRNIKRPKHIKKEIKKEGKSFGDSDSTLEEEKSKSFNAGSQTPSFYSTSSQTYTSLHTSSQTQPTFNASSKTQSPFNAQVKKEPSSSNVSNIRNKYGKSMESVISLNKTSVCGNIAADEAFRWLISPLSESIFFNDIFEKKPFHEIRHMPFYYKELFSGNDLNTILKENNLQYKVHIDLLKYCNDLRMPLDADGRAYCSNVWDDYKQGYSVRIRNPQSYHKKLWNFCSLLQEYFSSSVGVNLYLTPPNAQGFPPHYDDIDAIIAQIEGTKHWRIYRPRNSNEELARYPSIDFSQSDLQKPMLEVTLKAGDLLYIPRGYIHQALTSSKHSLHLTFSVNQLNTWGDLLLTATRKALERAIVNDVAFRKSVPLYYMDCAGISISENSVDEEKREAFASTIKKLAKKTLNYLDVDEAADDHALGFIKSSLPMAFNKVEKQRSIHGNGSQYVNGNAMIKSNLTLETEIQIVRKRSVRLVIDETGPKIYHTLENSKDSLEESEVVFVEFDQEGVPAFSYLLQKHPEFVKIKDLPLSEDEDKVLLANSLFENGLLMTKEPLPMLKENDWSNKDASTSNHV